MLLICQNIVLVSVSIVITKIIKAGKWEKQQIAVQSTFLQPNSQVWKPLMTDNVCFVLNYDVFRSKNVVFYRLCFSWQIMHCFCFWQKNVFWQIVLCLRQMMVSRQTILFEIIKINLLIDLNRYEEDYSDLGRDPDLNDMRINPSTFSLHSLRRFHSLSIIFLLLIIDIFIIIIFPLLLNHFVRH